MEDYEFADEVIAILPEAEREQVLNLQGEVTNLKLLLDDLRLDRDWVQARIYAQRQLAQRIVQEVLERHR